MAWVLGSAEAAAASLVVVVSQHSAVRMSSAKLLSEGPESCSVDPSDSLSDPSWPQIQLLPSIETSGAAPRVGSAFPVITAEKTDGIFKHNCTAPRGCSV